MIPEEINLLDLTVLCIIHSYPSIKSSTRVEEEGEYLANWALFRGVVLSSKVEFDDKTRPKPGYLNTAGGGYGIARA